MEHLKELNQIYQEINDKLWESSSKLNLEAYHDDYFELEEEIVEEIKEQA
jgi:hypothetical protein